MVGYNKKFSLLPKQEGEFIMLHKAWLHKIVQVAADKA